MRPKLITAFGQTLSLPEWSKKVGINRMTLFSRLKSGLSLEQALSIQPFVRSKAPWTKRPEYQCWRSMIHRCTNPNAAAYRHYGGRGITVYEEWRWSFEAFVRDIGERPSRKHSIERVDNDKGYFPGNCVWATINEQRRNTRYTKKLTFNGKSQAIQSWSEEIGIKAATIAARIRSGWSVDRALSTPVVKR